MIDLNKSLVMTLDLVIARERMDKDYIELGDVAHCLYLVLNHRPAGRGAAVTVY